MGKTSTTISDLSIIYANIRGLYPNSDHSKIPYLQTLTSEKPTIVALTETHLSSDIINSEITMNGYSVHRTDRLERSHGGVMIYIPNEIPCELILSHSNSVCEVVGINTTINKRQINFINVYIPPDCKLSDMRNIIEKITQCPQVKDQTRETIITGDFNVPQCEWDFSNKALLGPKKNAKVEIISEMMETLLLSQHVHGPTRQDNILDLVMTNNADMVNEIEITPTIHSDHNLIIISTNISTPSNAPDQHRNIPYADINLQKTNWEKVNQYLSLINWHEEMQNCNAEECWQIISDHLDKTLYRNSPLKPTPAARRKRITKEHSHRQRLMRRRTKVVKQIKRYTLMSRQNNTKYSNLTKELEEIENEIKLSSLREHSEEEKQAIAKIKSNSKFFYSYAKRKATVVSNIGPLVNPDNNSLMYTSDEMANILQTQY